MKKLLSLLLVVTLFFAVALTGCSSNDEPAPAEEQNPAEEPAPAEEPQQEEEDFIVGFIYIGHIGDGGWTDAHNAGRLYLEEQLDVKTIYQENVPESQEIENVIANMVDQGAKVIVASSFGYMDYVAAVSEDYPDVAFLHCSGYITNENMGNYFGRMYEPRYLSGIVAGLQTKTNKIGYAAAMGIPEVVRGINSFALGVKSVNPDAKVYVRWTNTWIDPAKAKEAAKALLEEGCDVMAQHQDSTSPIQAAADYGATAVGYNIDASELVPEAFLTAPTWNWGAYYVSEVEKIMAGNWTPNSYWGGLKEGIVGLAPITDIAPEGAKEAVEAVKDQILDGSFHPFQGPVYNQAGELMVKEGEVMSDGDMLTIDWFVDNVEGTIE